MKKISFIIPVYNCEQYIEKSVEHILDIGISDYEVLLVDDGSIDSSGEICDKLALKYHTIKVIHQENKGASSARNRGIEEATGEYLIFLDADDHIEPDKMKDLLIKLDNKDVDMAIYGMSFDYFYKNNCYRQDETSYSYEGMMSRVDWAKDFIVFFHTNSISPVWNKVFKKDIIDEYHLRFSEDMIIYEDLEFSLRYMSYCNNIYNSMQTIYHYRQTEDEGNAGRRLKIIAYLSKIVEKIEDSLERIPIQKEVKEQILLDLYRVLLHEKISVSKKSEIISVCREFRDLMKEREEDLLKQKDKFIERVINQKVNSLILHREYIKLRHKIAVFVKNTIRGRYETTYTNI